MDYKTYFKDKKITVMGLGLLGRGIGDVRFLAKHGAKLVVTDLKTKEQLASSLKLLKKYEKNITYILGEHRLENFKDVDMVIKAGGVPLDSVYIAEARKHGVPVEMTTSLFGKFVRDIGAHIVGVTGTRGKSTTTHLIYQIFEYAYRNKPQSVYLGGNVKGVSTIELLPKLKSGDIVVLELDSWLLQGFGEARISPEIAVFTTFMSDHMNYYKDDMDAYFADKANIYLYQNIQDTLIVGEQVSVRVKKVPGKKVVVGNELLPKSWKIKIPGDHNKYNISLAIAAARAASISEKDIKKVVEVYKGVEGRLEHIKDLKESIKIYNDTTSTTPDALYTALTALGKKKNIALIMGGADKKLDMNKIYAPIKKYVKSLICLPGSGTTRISTEAKFMKLKPVFVESMKLAVACAYACAQKGDTILLSPGFASFGIFKNEFDRGEQFNKEVKKLK